MNTLLMHLLTLVVEEVVVDQQVTDLVVVVDQVLLWFHIHM
tara:strand:- start:982 stop:1104 length:123 start_codon:yes stop_codon:yes gene_type:complete